MTFNCFNGPSVDVWRFQANWKHATLIHFTIKHFTLQNFSLEWPFKEYDQLIKLLHSTQPKKVPWLDLPSRQVNTLCTRSLNREQQKDICRYLRGESTLSPATRRRTDAANERRDPVGLGRLKVNPRGERTLFVIKRPASLLKARIATVTQAISATAFPLHRHGKYKIIFTDKKKENHI